MEDCLGTPLNACSLSLLVGTESMSLKVFVKVPGPQQYISTSEALRLGISGINMNSKLHLGYNVRQSKLDGKTGGGWKAGVFEMFRLYP